MGSPALDGIGRRVRAYGWAGARADLRAGAVVGAVLVPMGMTYAVLAGVPPVYGLYASLVPLVAYAALGASRHLAVGPAAVDMVVVAGGVGAVAAEGSAEYASLVSLVALLVGAVHVIIGAARLDALARLLSRPVVAGFMTGAPVVIAASQVGALLGLDLARDPVGALVGVAQRAGEAHGPTVAVGAAALAVVAGLGRWRRLPAPLAAVAAGAAASWVFGLEAAGVATVGPVPSGLPRLALPSLGPNPWASVAAVGPTVLALALVQLLGVTSVGRGLADRAGEAARPMRDVLAVGAANVASGAFGAIPVSVSFSRSAVNVGAGARSSASNAVAAVVVALALGVLTPAFALVPSAVLAAVIVVSALRLVDVRGLVEMAGAHPWDGAVAAATASVTVALGVQEGLAVGVGVSVLGLLWRASRADVVVLGREPGTDAWRDASRTPGAAELDGVVPLRVRSSLSFANAPSLADRVRAAACGARAVVLDLRDVSDLDATAAAALARLLGELEAEGALVVVVSPSQAGPLERGGAGGVRWAGSVREAVAALDSGERDERPVSVGDQPGR